MHGTRRPFSSPSRVTLGRFTSPGQLCSPGDSRQGIQRIRWGGVLRFCRPSQPPGGGMACIPRLLRLMGSIRGTLGGARRARPCDAWRLAEDGRWTGTPPQPCRGRAPLPPLPGASCHHPWTVQAGAGQTHGVGGVHLLMAGAATFGTPQTPCLYGTDARAGSPTL